MGFCDGGPWCMIKMGSYGGCTGGYDGVIQ
jgi:hypothetical protein